MLMSRKLLGQKGSEALDVTGAEEVLWKKHADALVRYGNVLTHFGILGYVALYACASTPDAELSIIAWISCATAQVIMVAFRIHDV